MKITELAKAMILPAAIAGLMLPAWAAQEAPPHTGGHVHAQQAGKHHPRHPEHARHHLWVSVRAGETLSGIATRHRMTWQAIYATPPNYRHLASPDLLAVGQRLRIPDKPGMRAAQFAARFAAVSRAVTAPARSGQAPASGTQPGQRYQPPVTQPAAPSSAPAASAASSAPAGGAPSSFQRCVAWRESGNNPTASSAGLYGIMPSTWASLGYSGTAGQASVAQQNAAFQQLYAKYGTAPWSAYDGC